MSEATTFTVYYLPPKRPGRTCKHLSKRVKVAEGVETRQQARQICRNRALRYGASNLRIKHPDGTLETFTWKGVL